MDCNLTENFLGVGNIAIINLKKLDSPVKKFTLFERVGKGWMYRQNAPFVLDDEIVLILDEDESDVTILTADGRHGTTFKNHGIVQVMQR
jgi:hypothetical protein